MKKSVLSKIRKSISPEVIKKTAEYFTKSEDWVRKVIRGEYTNYDILDYAITQAIAEKELEESRKLSVEEKASAL